MSLDVYALITDFQSNIDQLKSTNEEYTHKIINLDCKLEKKKQRVRQLKEENQRIAALKNELNVMVDSLSDVQATLQSENNYLKEENQQLQIQKQQLEQECSRQQHASSATLQRENEILQSEKQELQIIIDGLQSRLQQENSYRVEELETIAESLRDQLLKTETQFQEAESFSFRKIKTLEEENNQLKYQLSKQGSAGITRSTGTFDITSSQFERQVHVVETMEVRESTLRDKYTLREELLAIPNLSPSMFNIIRVVGTGSYGTVMFCSIQGQKQRVALKMISPFGSICNELSVLPDISRLHPNIIYTYTSFEAVPTPEMLELIDPSIRDLCYNPKGDLHKTNFFVLEFHQTTLDMRLQTLSLLDILKYSRQLASALVFLKEQKIVHLDFTSDNLVISSLGDVVVTDFGCSAKLNNAMEAPNSAGGRPTALAPEVLQAKVAKRPLPCEKQYSWELGTIIYEMFAKRYPFDNYSGKNLGPLNLQRISLHSFRELINGLLAPQPEERIPIEQALEQILYIQRQDKLY